VSVYSSTRNTVIEKKCENHDCCEYGVVQELAAFQELGAALLRRDDDVYCRACREEMVDAF